MTTELSELATDVLDYLRYEYLHDPEFSRKTAECICAQVSAGLHLDGAAKIQTALDQLEQCNKVAKSRDGKYQATHKIVFED